MGGRGMVAPGGGRENYKAARSRRSFARTLGGAAQQAENVPSMDVTSQRMGGTSPATVLHVDPRVASAAGVRGTSIGRVIAQPDGRHRAESAIAGQKPRYFRSANAAREHVLETARGHLATRVGGAVPLRITVAAGGARTARAAKREAAAVTASRRERIPLAQARRFVRG